METLDVYLDRQLVGRLTREGGALAFRYEADYLDQRAALPLSRHLPKDHREFADGPTRAFFDNLLPEGGVRDRVARTLGLSKDNVFALLAALGGDCAGAVRVLPNGQQPQESGNYRPIGTEVMASELATLPAHPFLVDDEGVRLSLAGAQNKLPVRYDGAGFFIPEGAAPSTHILKTPIAHLENTVVNEAFCMNLAARVGLTVPRSEVVDLAGTSVYLVERFDRRPDGENFIRLHQEDFCQALGIEPACKYEKEGGPGFAACFDLLRQWSDEPLPDVAALLRWALFNFLIGNADAHGKNIGFLYADGRVRLAPFYDLISTAVYPRQVNNKFAMRMGGQKDPRYLAGDDLEKFAAEIGVGLRGVRNELRTLAGRVESAGRELAAEYRERYGNPVIVGRIEEVLAQRLGKAKTLT
jgi:serine/threonine-protein kinase HipA